MKRKILIADSDPQTRHMLAQVSESLGAEPHVASKDDSAFELFLEVGPDVVLIDVLLPRRGGIDLLRRIRKAKLGSDVPVFMLSAVKRTMDLKKESVDALKAKGFFPKPVAVSTLQEALRPLISPMTSCAATTVRPFDTANILTDGRFGNTDFPSVFMSFIDRKVSGRMILTQGKVKKAIFFNEGRIAFIVSNRVEETMGRFLMREGRVSDEDYREALRRLQDTKQKMGQIFIEMGVLDEEEVNQAVRDNLIYKIMDVFNWKVGEFKLTHYVDPPSFLPGEELEGHSLLWQGLRDKFPFGNIMDAVKPYLDLYLMPQTSPEEAVGDLLLSDTERAFIIKLGNFAGMELTEALSKAGDERNLRLLFYLLVRQAFVFNEVAECAYHGPSDGDEMATRLAEAQTVLNNLRVKNHFQILGIPLNADDQTVKDAYHDLAKGLHPDSLGPDVPEELRQVYSDTFVLARQAYDQLQYDDLRHQYLASLRSDGMEGFLGGEQIMQGEALFQSGMDSAKKKLWNEAADFFAKAFNLNPNEAEYALHLGIARSHQSTPSREEALADAEKYYRIAHKNGPNLAEPFYQLGVLNLSKKNIAKAFGYFQRTLSQDSDHVDAQRQLRLLRMRHAKELKNILTAAKKKER